MSYMYTLTSSQQIVLAVTPKITGLLSVLGSFWIIVEVLSQKSKRHNVYHRLIFAMSVFDTLTSLWVFASTWPIPKGTEGVAFAAGNEPWCVAQGFFLQLGMASPYYNFSLALYYMLVVKYNVPEERLRRQFEPVVHILCVVLGFGPAIAGIPLNLYNAANLWCWIGPLPADCLDSYTYGDETSDCIRGDNAWIYRWAFYFGPLWLIIVLVTAMMGSTYLSVRKKEQEAIAIFYPDRDHGNIGGTRNHHATAQHRSSVICNNPNTATKPSGGATTKKPENDYLLPPNSSQDHLQQGPVESSDQQTNGEHSHLPPPPHHPARTTSITKKQQHHKRRPSLMEVMSNRLQAGGDMTMLVPKSMMGLISSRTNSGDAPSTNAAVDSQEIDYVVETIEEYPSAHQQVMELNQFGTQAVFQQFILYTAAFYTCYTFPTINRIVEQVTGNLQFGLLFMHTLLLPLQGLFNVLIYRYGYYFRLKQRYPEMTSRELFVYTWRWSFLGPPRNSSREIASLPPPTPSSNPASPSSNLGSPNANTRKSEDNNNGMAKLMKSPLSPSSGAGAENPPEGSDDAFSTDLVGDRNNQAIILTDECWNTTPDAPLVGSFMADMLYNYSEYPNIVSGQDTVLVLTAFPTMVREHSNEISLASPLTTKNLAVPSAAVFPANFED